MPYTEYLDSLTQLPVLNSYYRTYLSFNGICLEAECPPVIHQDKDGSDFEPIYSLIENYNLNLQPSLEKIEFISLYKKFIRKNISDIEP
jgi:hypothetical protein